MSRPLDVLFLGSGNAFAAGRYWSSFLVNERYLFDCSPIVLPHLKQCEVPPEDVEAVFITHFHADHFFGLPFLLLEYAELNRRTKDLTIVGPPGIEDRLRTVTMAGFPNLFRKERSYRETYQELHDGFEAEIAGAKVIARLVNHVPGLECFGYRVEIEGRAIAYSGDSTLCDALLQLGDGADAFVIECSCWNGTCGPHMGPDDVRDLRKRLGPKPTFILTHLDAGQQDLGIENVLVAQDLARFTL